LLKESFLFRLFDDAPVKEFLRLRAAAFGSEAESCSRTVLMAKACTLFSYLKTLADVKAKMKARLEIELI
jgi:plasmid stability protein